MRVCARLGGLWPVDRDMAMGWRQHRLKQRPNAPTPSCTPSHLLSEVALEALLGEERTEKRDIGKQDDVRHMP